MLCLAEAEGRNAVFFAALTTQLAFLGLHALVGWCPPAALYRRLGFRTSREIESERRALRRALDGSAR